MWSPGGAAAFRPDRPRPDDAPPDPSTSSSGEGEDSVGEQVGTPSAQCQREAMLFVVGHERGHERRSVDQRSERSRSIAASTLSLVTARPTRRIGRPSGPVSTAPGVVAGSSINPSGIRRTNTSPGVVVISSRSFNGMTMRPCASTRTRTTDGDFMVTTVSRRVRPEPRAVPPRPSRRPRVRRWARVHRMSSTTGFRHVSIHRWKRAGGRQFPLPLRTRRRRYVKRAIPPTRYTHRIQDHPLRSNHHTNAPITARITTSAATTPMLSRLMLRCGAVTNTVPLPSEQPIHCRRG